MKRGEREEFVGKMTARIDARMLSCTPDAAVRNKKQRRRKSAIAHKFITLLQRPPASDMNVALAWRHHIAKKKDENQRVMGENNQSEARLRNAPRLRRQKQRTTVIPLSMRKKNRPQSSLSRLSMEARDKSSHIATLIDIAPTRIQNMKGYAKQCEKRNTRQLLYKSFRRRQQRPNSAVYFRSPRERQFVHDQELAMPRLQLAGEKKILMASAAVNAGQRNAVFSSRNRVVKKIKLSDLDYVKMKIPGVPHLIGRREHE